MVEMIKKLKKPDFTYEATMLHGKLKSAKAHLDIKGDDVEALDCAISTLIRLRREILEAKEAEDNQQ